MNTAGNWQQETCLWATSLPYLSGMPSPVCLYQVNRACQADMAKLQRELDVCRSALATSQESLSASNGSLRVRAGTVRLLLLSRRPVGQAVVTAMCHGSRHNAQDSATASHACWSMLHGRRIVQCFGVTSLAELPASFILENCR